MKSNKTNKQQKSLPSLRFPIMLALTLGLAPFFPEPHIWGKIKWLWGGGVGMQPMDYFDVLLHGFPWLFLLLSLFYFFKSRYKTQTTKGYFNS